MLDKRKKILFVITYLELGGAQKQLLSIIKNLDSNKYSLYLFTGDRGYLRGEFLKLSFLNIKSAKELVRNVNPLYDFIAFFKLYFYIKRNKFDIVHTHSPKASILGRWAAYLAGTRNIVYTVHGWPFHRFMNPLIYYFYLFLERITAKITKKIIVVSKADLETGMRKVVASRSKFILIHYGVDVKKFDEAFREREKLKPANLIVTIACLKPQKGLCYFLKMAEAFLKERPDLNFLIIGDGPLRKKITRRIKLTGLKGRVILQGWVDDAAVLIKKSLLFISTSLWEGLPLAVIEAVISGVPVVIANTGGVLDIAENNKQGKIVEPANTFEIKNACRDILENYEEWSRIIRQSRQGLNLSYWSSERMLKETDNIYEVITC